jgi:hypothetical protein
MPAFRTFVVRLIDQNSSDMCAENTLLLFEDVEDAAVARERI